MGGELPSYEVIFYNWSASNTSTSVNFYLHLVHGIILVRIGEEIHKIDGQKSEIYSFTTTMDCETVMAQFRRTEYSNLAPRAHDRTGCEFNIPFTAPHLGPT